MSDFLSPIVRLFGPSELPVRIADWPEGVGVAVCRVGGKTISFQPYHTEESGQALKKRLPEEAGETLRGFSCYPALKGVSEAQLDGVENARITAELDNALRSMPRLIESAADFAINFVFAAEEGLGLDQLADAAKKVVEVNAAAAAKAVSEQLPVGYVPFVQADPTCQVISGALLRPIGAAGVDLLLTGEDALGQRELPPEVQVLVRDDSLRVAVPLVQLGNPAQLPNVMRLPAGSLMLGQTGGKLVPALVMRRGAFLFVAPDHSAVGSAAAKTVRAGRGLPWKWIGVGLGALIAVAAVVAVVLVVLPGDAPKSGPVAPVNDLRSNLFAPAD